MDPIYIAAAIPFFFLLIGIEIFASRRKRARRYAFHDSITNLSCGVGQLVFDAFFAFFAIGAYSILYDRFRLTTLSMSSAAAWVGVMLLVDLCYYVFHRVSHRVNLFWAAHVVHHQSEEYNLSVALRQAWFERPLEGGFYLPLAFLGFPPAMFLTAITVNTLYQFWIHTRAIGRLGPLEWVLNTPSHHRVHHGSNPKYIDKNYAGILVIWDRLFGTFQGEEEEPVYGLVKPLGSFNPLWANVHYWTRIAELTRASTRPGEKLTAWLRPPEWLPEALGGRAVIPEVSRETQAKYATAAPRALDAYAFAQFAIISIFATAYILLAETIGTARLVPVAAWFVASMVSFGAFFEGKRWGVGLEIGRLAALPALAAWLSFGTRAFLPMVGAAGVCAVVSGAVFLLLPKGGEAPAVG
jgi:alkylglycerol monooxygenase